LALGDIVCANARDVIAKNLWNWRKELGVDCVIANGENVCCGNGNGLDRDSAQLLLQSGVDCLTGGNHTFRRHNLYSLLEDSDAIVRPANYPDSAPGVGMGIVDKGRYQVGVASILGQLYLNPTRCPFEVAQECVSYLKDQGCKIILLDIHAEATSEKKALAYEWDGKVSAVLGTHTHVQTADEQILPCGTAYITDVGMCGPFHSVLGVKKEQSISLLKDKLPVRFETARGECRVDGVVITVDEKTGLATHIERFYEMVKEN
jgi:metallophosphoesterase (TIGR00282 family)